MNIQNILNQLKTSTNPLQMTMNSLNQNQTQMTNQFKNKTKEEQAKLIADLCNEKGITKEELNKIINGLKG